MSVLFFLWQTKAANHILEAKIWIFVRVLFIYLASCQHWISTNINIFQCRIVFRHQVINTIITVNGIMPAALRESPRISIWLFSISVLTSCLFPSLLCFLLFFLLFSISSLSSYVFSLFVLDLFLFLSPEEFRLWAPGDHEEATGETGSQHLWFRGGVFWWRQHPLSSIWLLPAPSFLCFIFFLLQTPVCCFLALLILRRRPTTPSLWRSCDAGRSSSARLRRK